MTRQVRKCRSGPALLPAGRARADARWSSLAWQANVRGLCGAACGVCRRALPHFDSPSGAVGRKPWSLASRARPSGCPYKRLVSRFRRCVEARALPAGRLSAGGHETVPSARHPISQTQHASSRATATLATHGLLPAARSASCLRQSRAVASSHRRLTAGGTEEPLGAPFGFGEQAWKCHAASTSARLEAELPALVMPPLASAARPRHKRHASATRPRAHPPHGGCEAGPLGS